MIRDAARCCYLADGGQSFNQNSSVTMISGQHQTDRLGGSKREPLGRDPASSEPGDPAGPVLVANSLCRGQEKRTIRESDCPNQRFREEHVL